MHQIIINESTFHGCRSKILEAKVRYGIKAAPEKKWLSWKQRSEVDSATCDYDGNPLSNRSTGSSTEVGSPLCQSLALIIDGNSLVHALKPALEKDVSALKHFCANQCLIF